MSSIADSMDTPWRGRLRGGSERGDEGEGERRDEVTEGMGGRVRGGSEVSRVRGSLEHRLLSKEEREIWQI